MTLSDLLEIEVLQCTDSQARLVLHDRTGGALVSCTGRLRGPECRTARTLPCSFPLRAPSGDEAGEILVTEPCYWSPSLPMLYRLELELAFADGQAVSLVEAFGLRRWEAFGASFRLEGRRLVLRGGSLSTAEATHKSAQLNEAYDAGAAVILVEPSSDLLSEASELGVNVIVDLRGCDNLPEKLRKLTWKPAAVFAIVDEQLQDYYSTVSEIKLVQAMNSRSAKSELSSWGSAVLIELNDAERPPSWMADCGRPVIARRLAAAPTDFSAARAACDQFQAELAPEFDFAGYFHG